MLKRSLTSGVLLWTLLSPAWGREIPYEGGASGTVLESIPLSEPVVNGAPFLRERAEAVGHFNLIGRAHVKLEWLVSVKSDGAWSGIVVEGTYTINGANGNSMSGTFVSHQDFNSQDSVIVVEVLSGAGRFIGVHGEIPGVGHRDGNNFSYRLDGMLTFPERGERRHRKFSFPKSSRGDSDDFDDVAE
jgi:hypothetical protein